MILLRYGFETHHHVAVHLHETAVGVPCEAGVARASGDGFDGLVVHAQVEDRIHHARHRGPGARAHRDQQGHILVAELHAGEPFDIVHRLFHFGAEQLHHIVLAVGVILRADFGRDGEPRRYGHADQVHLREVGSLASEELSHLAVTLRFLVAEGVNAFDICHNLSFKLVCCVIFSA